MGTSPEFLQKLLTIDANARVVCQVNKTLSIDYVSLQTSAMSEVFSKFPEVLLMIRSHNIEQRALYTFLADGPRVGAPYDITRMVHVAIPTDESPEGLARMFKLIKEINPQWPLIQVFLVDPGFTEINSIYQAFPSVEVAISAAHIYSHIKSCIHELFLPDKAQHLLIRALKNTGCSATESNLKNMYKMLLLFVNIKMLLRINPEWLLQDRIWALHRWRSWNDCSCYFDMVESLSQGLKTVFNISICLTRTMSGLISYIIEQTEGKSQPEARACSLEELAIIKCKAEAFKRIKEEAPVDPEPAASICESLNKICNPAAFELCQNELDVTQKSVELIGTKGDKTCVQILENPCMVTNGKPKTCTCGFYQSTEIPCRHILAVLHANEELLQPDMLHPLWQKQPEGTDYIFPVSADKLEILKTSKNHVSDKHLLVNSVTSQLSALLAECSEENFQRRYKTLRELADVWIGPYEQVKL
ncbi:zinc finger SWIM domain-containing protein 1 [Leptodactylus fuscus]|uniref:zinc finger SWIM domain-containing protein 1 n=1 Tax=Leptodactylus fuscus TaxID=238119 RepID=UPI003F4EE2C8